MKLQPLRHEELRASGDASRHPPGGSASRSVDSAPGWKTEATTRVCPELSVEFIFVRSDGRGSKGPLNKPVGNFFIDAQHPGWMRLSTGKAICVIPTLGLGEESQVFAANIRAGPDESRLAMASAGGVRVDIWDLSTGQLQYTLPDEPGRSGGWLGVQTASDSS